MNTAAHNLEKARQELLYLGLRNPLINFRPLQARGVEVEDELPAEVWRQLVVDGRPMGFLEKSGGTGKQPSEGALGQPDENGIAARHRDEWLQTSYDSVALQKRLLNTSHFAQTYIDDHGVNILYLALGALCWYETETAEQPRRAPLILIPVTLDRSRATERFRIRYTGTEIGTNLSLAAKLRIDFGLRLPDLPTADEALDVNGYFDAVEAAVAPQARWSVDRTAVSLAFFSFSKFLIFNDLDPACWPANRQPADHPVMRALLNPEIYFDPLEDFSDSAIDDHVSLAESHLVVDADSSQTRAIVDVNAGHSLVIQGPPGTGKSQTIANLIAEALGNGRTVLFVSEKMAALDVVKRRLDTVGLGDAALPLHSHKTTKRVLAVELKRTLELGRPKNNGQFDSLDALIAARDQLNAYTAALHTEIGRSALTPYTAYGRLIQLEGTLAAAPSLPQFNTGQMREWSAEVYAARLALVGRLQALLVQMGTPEAHAFWGSKASEPVSADAIRERSAAAAADLAQLVAALGALSAELGFAPPATHEGLQRAIATAQRALSAPNLFAVDVAHPLWRGRRKEITAVVEDGMRASTLFYQYDDVLIPAAWEQDVLPIRQALMAHGGRFWRFMSSDYRVAKERLLGLCRRELPEEHAAQLALVDAILEVQRLRPQVERLAPTLAQLFGARWQGVFQTDWRDMATAAYWLSGLYDDLEGGQLPPPLVDYLARGFDNVARQALEAAVAAVLAAGERHQTVVRELMNFIGVERYRLTTRPFEEQAVMLRRFGAEAATFGQMVAWNELAAELRDNSLTTVASNAQRWSGAPTLLRPWFERGYVGALVEKAHVERPVLGRFEGGAQRAAAERFQQLDRAFLQANRARLAHEHWVSLPKYTAVGQLGLLISEANKRTNHMPIRQLMERAGSAIQRLKPVFMMSPLSIAMFLPPEALEFDLVIFDEASQVRPVEAFGAILRGKQAVVVGDSQQLPPTTFFDRVLGEGEVEREAAAESGDEEWLVEEGVVGDNESVLDLFVARGAPQRMLRWHYRSRHESLIAVSNAEFYNGRLVVFPSPSAQSKALGVRLHYLPETVYERGTTRTNPQEALAVAAAVMAQAQAEPELSLGVAAFSATQRIAIEEALERLRREDPSAERFFAAHPTEPFFIKNLENVQGDERDVIFISVGYGRTESGRVSLNFGPLNAAGGERRLNVLITRAKRRCEIFTNLTAEEIDLGRAESRGMAALKAYLAFAEGGELAESARGMKEHGRTAPFEEVVAETLEAAGHTVVRQVGRGGIVVDVAVHDGAHYLLGVACDGNDGRAQSARDRERIQFEVLARLGWRMHRVWSTEWVRGAVAERERLLTAVAGKAPLVIEAAPTARAAGVARFAAEPLVPRPVAPYTQAELRVKLNEREGWRYKGKGIFESLYEYLYCYDPLNHVFRLEERIPWHQLKHDNDPLPVGKVAGKLYNELRYDMTEGTFAADYAFRLVTEKGVHWLDYNFETDVFHVRQQEGGGRLIYSPLTGEVSKGGRAVNPATFVRSKFVNVEKALALAVRQEVGWVREIVAVEQPVHREEVKRSLARAAGYKRRSSTVDKVVDAAVAFALEQGMLEERDGFLQLPGLVTVTVRSRSGLPSVSRTLELVADAELDAAILLAAEDAFGITAEEITTAVTNLLGFGSLGDENQERIVERTAALLEMGRLVWRGNYLQPQSAERAVAEAEAAARFWQQHHAVAETAKKKVERPLTPRPRPAAKRLSREVAVAEIAEAALAVARERPRAARFMGAAIAKFCGVERPSRTQRQRIRRMVALLEEAGQLVPLGGRLHAAEEAPLTLAEVVALAELELKPEVVARPLPPNAYVLAQRRFNLWEREGWVQERAELLSEHHYRYLPEENVFVLAGRQKLADILARPWEVASGIYASLIYWPETGDFLAGPAHVLVVRDTVLWLWRDGASGIFYARSAEDGAYDLRYDVTGFGEFVQVPHFEPKSPFQFSVKVDEELALLLALPDLLHLEHIVETEGPILTAEAAGRFDELAGLGRQSPSRLFERTLALGLGQGDVVARDGFLWLANRLLVAVRDRSRLPERMRSLRLVAREEIGQALLEAAVRAASRKKVKQRALEALGVERPSAEEQARLDGVFDELLGYSLLVVREDGEVWVTADEERFLGEDGLPTAVVEAELAAEAYAAAEVGQLNLLAREGWTALGRDRFFSEHYYPLVDGLFRFEGRRLEEEITAEPVAAKTPISDKPGPGVIYAQLKFNPQTGVFSLWVNLYAVTAKGVARVWGDGESGRFYLFLQSREGVTRRWYDPATGAGEVVPSDVGLNSEDEARVSVDKALVEAAWWELGVVREIVAAEGSMHLQLLGERIAAAANLAADDEAILRLCEAAVAYEESCGRLARQGDFVSVVGEEMARVRQLGSLPKRLRRVAFVSEVEVQAAVQLILRHGSHLRFEDVAAALVELLGIEPLSQAERSQLVGVVQRLISAGNVVQMGNFLVEPKAHE